jgi:nuclear pore complex protein Nup98-Nup96
VPSNPFAPKTPSIGGLNFGSSSTPAFNSSPFGASTSSTFGVGSSPSIFGSSPLFSSSQATNAGFGSNTQSSPLFQSNAPSIGQAGSAFGQTTTSFGQNPSSPFGQGILGASTTPGFGVNTFSSTSSLISSSNALGFGQSNVSSSLDYCSFSLFNFLSFLFHLSNIGLSSL